MANTQGVQVQETRKVDVTVENHGSIFLFTLHTPEAQEWWQQNCEDGLGWGDSSKVVEHRFARDIAQGLLDDGLEVE